MLGKEESTLESKEDIRRWSNESELTERDLRDHELLVRLGKRPVMKRRFGFLTILGFTSTITCLWESTLLLMDQSLRNGGPEGFIYGFIVVWAGCLALFACMSELASMAPTAGGQYHWVAMMSPRRCQRFASYIEGWLAVTGWQGSSVSAAQLSARTILGLAKLCHPEFEHTTWQVTVVAIALIGFAMLINVTGGMVLPRFEGMVLVLHLVGFFAVLVPLLTLGEQVDATQVFDVFVNQGNFPSNGLTYWVGLAGIMYAFVGGDGAIHMSEEIHNAAVVVPRGIMFNYIVNGALALGISIAVLFSQANLGNLVTPPTGFAVMEVIQHSVHSLPGAAIMVSIITVLQISAGVSNYASATRILWGFARDQGVPGWSLVSRVDESTTVPLFACLITAFVGSALTCINIGSPTAFDDVVSVAIGGLYGSYLVACGLLLWRRCTGAISKHNPKAKDTINTVGFRLAWGPFHLKGLFGIGINIFACTYLLAAFFFVFWPFSYPVEVKQMNYASVLFGGVIILSSLYYLAWGRRDYFGPVVETNSGVSRHDQHPSLRRDIQISYPLERNNTQSSVRTVGTTRTTDTARTADTTQTTETVETINTAGSVRPPTAEYEYSEAILQRTHSQRTHSRNTSDVQVMGPLAEIGAPRRAVSGSMRRQPSDLSRAPTISESGRFTLGSARNSYESLSGSVDEIRRPEGAIHPLHPRAAHSAMSGRRTATPTTGYRIVERHGAGHGAVNARTMSLNSNSHRTASLNSKHGSISTSLKKRSLDPVAHRPSANVRPWVEGRWESERWEGTEWRDGDHAKIGHNWTERFGRDGPENAERVREDSRAREETRQRKEHRIREESEGGEPRDTPIEHDADGRNSYKRDARQKQKSRKRDDPAADGESREWAFDEGALAYLRKQDPQDK